MQQGDAEIKARLDDHIYSIATLQKQKAECLNAVRRAGALHWRLSEKPTVADFEEYRRACADFESLAGGSGGLNYNRCLQSLRIKEHREEIELLLKEAAGATCSFGPRNTAV